MSGPAAATASPVGIQSAGAGRKQRSGKRGPYVLDPSSLPNHIDALYRSAWALCGSRYDAEDLVQATFAHVLKRRRIIRNGNERGYLLRALRNTYSSRYRTLAGRPVTMPLLEEDTHPAAEPATVSSRRLMETIASAPPLYRDAVVTVDVLGLTYLEAARSMGTREATVATRLHRGRQHVARELVALGV